jgi:anti-sigma regulatory factor (Ser/Thr protein kinase)
MTEKKNRKGENPLELENISVPEKSYHKEYSLDGLEEHVVADEFIMPLIEGLPDNVVEILYYSATEMINNSIDHSEGNKVSVILVSDLDTVKIGVIDDGIGIFNKIKKVLKLEDSRDAILELCKGKLTTDPKRHTGEGIFFTSRACDNFVITSDDLLFGRTRDTDWLVDDRDQLQEGTFVYMEVGKTGSKKLEDVFSKFTSEEEDGEFGFTRTHIPISVAAYGPDGLVSRSKAKRVVNRFGKFKEVVLDFKGVESIGQAFADEIFRVFAKANPDVHISVINADEKIGKMIRRAETSNIDSEED